MFIMPKQATLPHKLVLLDSGADHGALRILDVLVQALLHNVANDTALGVAGLTVNIAAFALSAVCFSK